MKPGIILIFILLLISTILKANDSTALYKKRVQKIKGFYEWLAKRPYKDVNIFKADTASECWKSYDTAINLFFNRHILDSLYENKGQLDDIFATSLKFQLLKQSIASFHNLTQHECVNKLKFKYSDSNLVIQFFSIKNKDYEFSGFWFLNGSTQLIGMPILNLPEPEYRIFKTFYDKLKPCPAK